MRKELAFIAGSFFNFEIPFDKNYLFRYFRTPLEKQFLRYYFCFGEIDLFVEHTGCYCQKRWLKILKKRLDKVLATHENLKSNFEIEKLMELEKGKYKF